MATEKKGYYQISEDDIMVTEVLLETSRLDSDTKNHLMEVNVWIEYQVTLLPARGHKTIFSTSYTSQIVKSLVKRCTQQRSASRDQRCSYAGLTGSLRIEPGREYSHPREVKNREEEEKQRAVHQVTSRVPGLTRFKLTTRTVTKEELVQPNYLLKLLLVLLLRLGVTFARGRLFNPQNRENPHEHRPYLHTLPDRNAVILALVTESIEEGLPAYGRGSSLFSGREFVTAHTGQCRQGTTPTLVKIMCKNTTFKHGDLPPLPHRAIWGLPSGSVVSPNGSPFQTVHLWEFSNLYVLLGKKDWQHLSTYLKGSNLRVISRQVDIGYSVLLNIRADPDQSIVVPNLRKLCEKAELNLNSVEQSIRGVRFNTRGSIEHLKFPFVMDVYAWRILCHIVGDGNINNRKTRKYPDLRWSQLPENQAPMRKLLSRLSRETGGDSDQIWYPKALTYAMIGTMNGFTIGDLKTPKFLQFIIDLPPEYRDWKVQFLAAFIVDDGCISKDISFTQKDPTTLNHIIQLCDQLGYDHSHLYRIERDGVHNFQLRQAGIEAFYIDVHKLMSKDPLLGLWHKQSNFDSVATSFSLQRGFDNRQAKEVCVTIISILRDHQIYTTDELRQHPKLHPFLEGQPWYILNRRLEYLHFHDYIQEVMNNKNRPFRPKHWSIPSSSDPDKIHQDFLSSYGDRAHSQSYKRKFITREIAMQAISRLKSRGIKPNPTNTSREGGFSKNLFYNRDDLRDLFREIEEKEE